MTPLPVLLPPDNVGPFSGTRQRIKMTPTSGTVHLKPMRQHNRPGREAAVSQLTDSIKPS